MSEITEWQGMFAKPIARIVPGVAETMEFQCT